MSRPRPTSLLALVLAVAAPTPARGERPADPLLALVPPDAAVTVAVEDLRGQVQRVSASPLAGNLLELSFVREWMASDRFRRLRRAREKAEKALGENLVTVRDGLFGEAVVLTLRLPAGGRPADARGLLLLRVPDRPLLDRMIEGLNSASLRSGGLRRVSRRLRLDTPYFAREFARGKRADDYYATLDGRVFAWSNSEDLIRGVIDRRAAGSGGLSGVPGFDKVRARLPERAAASLFVNPRFIDGWIARSPRTGKPHVDRALGLLGRYVAAVRYAGAAVEWRDGVVLHTEEQLDPEKISPALRRWAARPDVPRADLRRVPPSALMAVAADVDAAALSDLFDSLVGEEDRPKLENFALAVKGLLLGRDFRHEIAPRLGPGITAYMERRPAENGALRFPVVCSVESRGGAVADAADNAFRTLLAVDALDASHGRGRLRVETRTVKGGTVTALNASSPFAYAVAEGRIVVGSNPETVAGALGVQSDPAAGTSVEWVRSTFFPDAVTFAFADLKRIHDVAAPRRSLLARSMAAKQKRSETDTGRDVDHVLAFLGTFDAAFLSSTTAPDFSAVHHSVGVVKAPEARR